ncbi:MULTISPECIES: Tol-Pal system beta propeller repeat protein TolB [unclassified Ectothiorhodospira]|uniref:Tol-Pal system beta propeller repeat protein TolB n=1 Tax=unclassified Ectothiorhodospira TaxID=2684909 RepID=UPI001EE95D13|nr:MULTISPECIES: Tol-Pal system beta propeller repeat protein TolB [unclassified Ectothiorhodospira]MCG5515911.1 Tol-Pal system beta propeller repeat protein TolB [Ectothiorhodospira sp. 9100]MCG5518749.1 Tol-Pal system beta propeller repeat protein TolB [Ectothiorhodospira sp. 9905]
MKPLKTLFLLLLLTLPLVAQGALEIRITQGVEGAMPVAIVPFAWDGETSRPPEDVAGIIAANLNRTGRFSPLDQEEMPQRPRAADEVSFATWRDQGSEYLVIGRVQEADGDRYAVRFQLFGVASGRQLTGYSIPVERSHLRRAAHMVSDIIYERLTGDRGAFDTQVAYVSLTRQDGDLRYALQVADADGHNPKTVFSSSEPILSPAWSPDGRRIAYVSFENRRSEIYIQDLDGGDRTRVASHEGINSAPAWSPDGRRLALTLSREGQPDIHVLNLADQSLTRVTQHRAIDTEPTWMPDGRSIVFTSDRAGQPQLYEVSVRGGAARRLTFEGRYNGGADISPDGRRLVMVHGAGSRFRIGLLDRESRLFRTLTDSGMDESPSFAPNGSMIIYATSEGGRGVLAAVSDDGRVHQRLVLEEGEVREPAWSPFLD